MKINRLRLKDFRGYESLNLDLPSGLILLEGDNGAGKTNLVEAIYFLTNGRSFRTSDDQLLVRSNQKAAYIEGDIIEGEIKRTLSVSLSKEGKRFYLYDKPLKRLSELSEVANASYFAPSDVNLFKGPPSLRRSFLDHFIASNDKSYLQSLLRYEKALRERNAALKALKTDYNLIASTTELLVKEALPIITKRVEFTKLLSPTIQDIASQLFSNEVNVKLEYRRFLPIEDFVDRALEAYNKNLDSDIAYGSTSIGVHREDFRLKLNDKDVGNLASQGQNRLLALALKIAPCFLAPKKEKQPILILDEPLSELDEAHQYRLLILLKNVEQTFITSTKVEENINSIIHIENHLTKWR